MYLKATKATRKSSITCAARDPARNLLLQPHIVFGRSFTRSSKPQGPSEVTETTKSNKDAGLDLNSSGNALRLSLHPFTRFQRLKDPSRVSQHVKPFVKDQIASSDMTVSPQPAITAVDGNDSGVSVTERTQNIVVPEYHWGDHFVRTPFWKKIPRWEAWSEKDFLDNKHLTRKDITGPEALTNFLGEVLPYNLPAKGKFEHIRTRDDFIRDVIQATDQTTMSIRLAPHVLSMIDWNNPFEDPIRLQFIPLKSEFIPDHPMCGLDSLEEKSHKVLDNLVHRYPDKVLFLTNSVCPHLCRFCTRSYSIGRDTHTVEKDKVKGGDEPWLRALKYINSKPAVQDVVMSGGDSFLLASGSLTKLGEAVLAIPHVRRLRIASKGLCVSPSRFLDPKDTWTDALIGLSNRGKMMGKEVYFHTHFNHSQEMSWVTREASQRLFQNGVKVRNQTVLLRGVNDDVPTMSALIRNLIDNHIDPYYVYQCDMVKSIEDLRTPLSTILKLQHEIRGSIGGYAMPSFVVDLPGGGGKRLATDYISYDPDTGISRWKPSSHRGEDRIHEYYDPVEFTKNGKRELAGKS